MLGQNKLSQGERANKVGGSYQATGTIVASFRTLAGAERYVFEFDNPPGMLHIFGPSQLEPMSEEVSVSGVPYKVPRSSIKSNGHRKANHPNTLVR